MFNSDKPITKIEDDVLNRGNFSIQDIGNLYIRIVYIHL